MIKIVIKGNNDQRSIKIVAIKIEMISSMYIFLILIQVNVYFLLFFLSLIQVNVYFFNTNTGQCIFFIDLFYH